MTKRMRLLLLMMPGGFSRVAFAESCPFPDGIRAIVSRWTAEGGAKGAQLGPATGDMVLFPGRDGCYQLFRHGAVYWSPSLGTKVLTGFPHGLGTGIG